MIVVPDGVSLDYGFMLCVAKDMSVFICVTIIFEQVRW